MKKNCAYCGKANAETMDHVIPRCLYPASTLASGTKRVTVPACANCNNGWSDDEAHFRTMLTLAGEPNAVATELWNGKVARGLRDVDGWRRVEDIWANMKAVQTATGERYKIFPASDPRFVRILRKIVRGLHYHHELWHPVPDDMVEADVLRFTVPEEFTESMPRYDFGCDVFEYQFETFDGFSDIPMRSLWLLTLFGNRKFIGAVWKPNRSEIGA